MLKGFPVRAQDQWFKEVNIPAPNYEIIIHQGKIFQAGVNGATENDFSPGIELKFIFPNGTAISVTPIDEFSEYWETEYNVNEMLNYFNIKDSSKLAQFEQDIITYAQELISVHAPDNYSYQKNVTA